VRQPILDPDAVDDTIHLFAPEIDREEIGPKPPPRHAAFEGEVGRAIPDALQCGRPAGRSARNEGVDLSCDGGARAREQATRTGVGA
jgi:hypothetical protein